MLNKRGQAAYEVSILIVIIALLLLIYIILLPPGQRQALLEDAELNATSGAEPAASTVLLSESPGRVFSYTTNKQQLNIEPVHIFSKIDSNSQQLVKSLTVSRNILKNNFKEILFDVKDLNKLDSAKLLFLIKESKGPITITLNNNLIYEGELDSSQMPIELPKSYLLNTGNVLRMETASTGWRLFSSNYYLLQDVILVKSLNIKNNRVARGFLINTEDQKIRTAKLAYFISCNDNQNGQLTISLNNRQVYRDLVFCQYQDEREVPLSKDLFSLSGSNTLMFEVDNGDYNLDQIKVNVELARSSYPTYNFEVDSDLWKSIRDGKSKVMLKLNLGEGRKKATFLIQGETVSMDTSSPVYERDITSLVENGANSIKIMPDTNFEISSLKVYRK